MGRPGVGKTTLLDELQKREYEVVAEIARELIKEQNEVTGAALPWKNKALYKKVMFDRSIRRFKQIDKMRRNNLPIFFDCGFLDTLCYATLIQSDIDESLKTYADHWRYNKKLFASVPN